MSRLTKENMSSHLVTIRWNRPVSEAYDSMRERQIRHLPVVDEEGAVIGIISDRDVQRALHSRVTLETSGVRSEDLEFDPKAQVRDYMSWPVKSVDLDADLKMVTRRMIQEKISALLVREGTKIVGIITTEDLMKLLLELLDSPVTPQKWNLDHYFKFDAYQASA